MNATYKLGCTDYQLTMLLCIECSRFSCEKNKIKSLVKDITSLESWPFAFEIIHENRLSGLVWKRLSDYELLHHVPLHVRSAWENFIAMRKKLVHSKLLSNAQLNSVLAKEGILSAPFKGAYLTPWVFNLNDLHYITGDIDLLVSSDHATRAAKIAEELGFKMLDFELKQASAEAVQKYENEHVRNHLHPLTKIVSIDGNVGRISLEIHSNVSVKSSGWAVNTDQILERSQTRPYYQGAVYQMTPVDALIAIAIHAHYSYAGIAWIVEGIDLCLKWFVDGHWLIERMWNKHSTTILLNQLAECNLGPIVTGYVKFVTDLYPTSVSKELVSSLESRYMGDGDVIYDHLTEEGSPWGEYESVSSWPVSFTTRLLNPDRGRIALPVWLNLGSKTAAMDRYFGYLDHRIHFNKYIWSSRSFHSPKITDSSMIFEYP